MTSQGEATPLQMKWIKPDLGSANKHLSMALSISINRAKDTILVQLNIAFQPIKKLSSSSSLHFLLFSLKYIVIEKYTNSNSQLWISWLGETKPANMYSSGVSIIPSGGGGCCKTV